MMCVAGYPICENLLPGIIPKWSEILSEHFAMGELSIL